MTSLPSRDDSVAMQGLDFRHALRDFADTRAAHEWAHFRLDSADIQTLAQQAPLDEALAEALLVDNARPRVARVQNGLLVVLRGVNLNPGADPEDMVSVRMWVCDSRVVSVSPRRVVAVQDVHDAIVSGEGPTTAAEVMVAITAALADRIAPTVDTLVDHVDDLQARILSEAHEDLPREVSDLRRATALMRRHLAPQRDATQRLYREPAAFVSDDGIAMLREVADRTMRYVEDLDSVRERAAVLQDELSHAATTALNRNMYMLSVVAAIFLPLSLLTGLLGINVGGMPGADSEQAFWVVVAALAVIAASEIWVFRKRKLF